MDLQRPLDFLELIYQFQRIERRIPRRGEDRLENDVEHSYQLALMAWFLNRGDRLGMDDDLLIRYALVHDLAEVYAGDTPAFTRDEDMRSSKEQREAKAISRIGEEFAEFPELIEAIHAYERRDSREARFVYALDKILPIMSNYLDEGRAWMNEGVTFDMMHAYKRQQIAESPEIETYFVELTERLRAQPSLFPRSLDAA